MTTNYQVNKSDSHTIVVDRIVCVVFTACMQCMPLADELTCLYLSFNKLLINETSFEFWCVGYVEFVNKSFSFGI